MQDALLPVLFGSAEGACEIANGVIIGAKVGEGGLFIAIKEEY